MKGFFSWIGAATMMLSLATVASALPPADTQASQDRLFSSVRHELATIPQLSVFDNLAFRVDGNTVTLSGQVRNAFIKDVATAMVKRIDGVEKINNQIEILPASINDDRIRWAEVRAIYGDDTLSRYSVERVPSIRIIVEKGNVTLEGEVTRSADKDTAFIRANGVPGVFSVTNHLRINRN